MKNNVAKIRNGLQLKRKTLARLSGVPERTIMELEQGNDDNIPAVILEELAEAMNVTVEDFFKPVPEAENGIIDNHLASNTEGIRKAIRKNVELLANELLAHPEKNDDERVAVTRAMNDYAFMIWKIDEIDKNIKVFFGEEEKVKQ